MFCKNCGKEIGDQAAICVHCGVAVAKGTTNTTGKSSNAAVILGVIGIITAWLIALVGHVVSIIGIVLGIKELKKSGKPVGLILSVIGEVCAIINSILGIILAVGMF